MAAFKRITINGPQFFQSVILPSFGELLPGTDVRNGYAGEFTVLDDVAHDTKIINIRGFRNVLQRLDKSCVLDYSPIMRAEARKLTVTELGGKIQFCPDEFFQGCLRQWQEGDQLFVPNILNFFKQAIGQDLISLMYFGDVTRIEDGDPEEWNTNKIDGIHTLYTKLLAEDELPEDQTISIPNGDISPANSKAYLESMFKRMDPMMKLVPRGQLGFYIDQEWADAYEDYLLGIGNTDSAGVNFTQDGIKVRAYKGIPILANPFFNPILAQITNQDAHFGVLTFRGNFTFGTDKNYGAGPMHNQAIVVWFDEDTETWKWKTKMRAGVQIGLVEQSVVAFNA